MSIGYFLFLFWKETFKHLIIHNMVGNNYVIRLRMWLYLRSQIFMIVIEANKNVSENFLKSGNL